MSQEEYTTGAVITLLESNHDWSFEAPQTEKYCRMKAEVLRNSFGSDVVDILAHILGNSWKRVCTIPLRNDWRRSK